MPTPARMPNGTAPSFWHGLSAAEQSEYDGDLDRQRRGGVKLGVAGGFVLGLIAYATIASIKGKD